MSLFDKHGRQITDLRISVTDRCNFRCVYCRSANPENHMAEPELLSWDELDRLARILVGLGIRKIRVTGGEPLVREGVEDFIARLRPLGVGDLSMTTNGHLLAIRSIPPGSNGSRGQSLSTKSWRELTQRKPRRCDR
jgi:cyclic pyranopterin phosphate synthase